MDSARQVIRWSIPGALFLMAGAASYLSMRVAQGSTLNDAAAPIRANLNAATGIALSIPLGFLVYQIYFLTYKPVRAFRIVSASRGLAVLECFTAEQKEAVARALGPLLAAPRYQVSASTRDLGSLAWTVGADRLTGAELLADDWGMPPASTKSWRNRLIGGLHLVAPDRSRSQRYAWPSRRARRAVVALYHARWIAHYTVASVLLDVASMSDHNEAVQSHATVVSDIYHAQGAARTGIFMGAVAGLAADALQIQIHPAQTGLPGWTLAGEAVIVLAVVWMLFVLSRSRRKSYSVSALRTGYALRASYAREPDLLRQLAGGPDPHRAQAA